MREEHGGEWLGERATCHVEREPRDDRRDRRAEQHRPRQQHVGVEELDVGIEVLVEVPAGLQRPRAGAHGVDGEPAAEERERPEPPARQAIEPCEHCGAASLDRCRDVRRTHWAGDGSRRVRWNLPDSSRSPRHSVD